jgi:aryl-alcohol dehydrogenase-like predicted oxidoreductase
MDILSSLKDSASGSPTTVSAGSENLVTASNADEVIVVTETWDHAARLKSCRLVAEIPKRFKLAANTVAANCTSQSTRIQAQEESRLKKNPGSRRIQAQEESRLKKNPGSRRIRARKNRNILGHIQSSEDRSQSEKVVMKYNTLGHTGLLVSELSLGTMTFSASDGIWKSIAGVEQKLADQLLRLSFDAGINFVDTADVYSNGASERVLAQSIANLGLARKDIVIATKAYGRTGPGRNDMGASRGHLMQAVEASLERLRTDYIDLYQIHASDSITPIEETLRALDTLVEQGKVRYIGCSNWYAWQIMKANGISEAMNLARLDTLQAYYSIAGRDLEREIVPLLKDQGTGLLVWSPLAGGLLSGKYSRENQKPEDSRRSTFDFPITDKERAWRILDVLRPVAATRDTSVAAVALAWILSKPFVTSIIIGAKREDQLQQNLAATELQLTADEIRQLDDVSTLPPEYPGWMIPFQNINRLADVPRI